MTKLMKQVSQMPNINSIRHMWHELKMPIQKRNMNDLRQYNIEEWSKYPLSFNLTFEKLMAFIIMDDANLQKGVFTS